MEIFSNESLRIECEEDQVYITVLKKGYSLKRLEKELFDYPRLSVTKFMVLKEALELADSGRKLIGELKPLAAVSLSRDKMEARLRLNCTEAYFKEEFKDIADQISLQLQELGVERTIEEDVLRNVPVQNEAVIAAGHPPQHGSDAVVCYYEQSERKPAIREDGTANYFDMNFIDEVQEGDWLGEKIPAEEGIYGETLTGEPVPPLKGKDKKLLYDKKTVKECEEDGKTVLRALCDGVVTFQGGRISVGRHLVIEGDAGPETGNIEFDGSITVRGIVKAGYSVNASLDISILGELGVSGFEEIVSKKGDIFIKGGAFGQGSGRISAGKNIYIKHSNECSLTAGGDIHIGYYSIGGILKGRNIFADEKKGKLIGGVIEAKGRVQAGIIGNRLERKTIIQIEGFDRNIVNEELEALLLTYRKKAAEMEKSKKQLEIFEQYINQLSEKQHKQYEQALGLFERQMEEIAVLDHQRKILMSLLETKGEGEVSILQVAYPETQLQIKSQSRKLDTSVRGTFYAVRNNMHFE
ncbi:DUF342 domain-containing protein [Bacillus infantis]|uniref:DUF342 domain-containing protein n=1 Tax=Bacillus infantis TaxID=324767 RepID=UPI003CF95682